MDVTTAQLAALVAIADRGSFEAAARQLHVTPSAVSQRIRALESTAGQVLVRRGTPCVPTRAGTRLVAVARQTGLLLAELDLDDRGSTEVVVAVNADSLATWFRPVLADLGAEGSVALRLTVQDQAFSHDLLRLGEVLAAVTSEPHAVQGCRVVPLGRMRYRPAATPELAARWRRGRGPDWDRMPVVVFNDQDRLQHDALQERGAAAPALEHRVPTSADFHEAVRLGLGWGMLPEAQLDADLESGRLVLLSRQLHHDVRLFWQCWRLDSPTLTGLTDAVRRAAGAGLRR